MDKIIVGFSRPAKWFVPFSWLIRLVDGTPYSHVYIRFYSDAYERWLVYQASGTRVNFIEWSRFEGQEIILDEFVIPVSTETKTDVIRFAIDNVGAPYGVLEVFGLAWVRFMMVFGKRVRNPFKDGESSFVCCELVSLILNEYDSQWRKLDTEGIFPSDVYKNLSSIRSRNG